MRGSNKGNAIANKGTNRSMILAMFGILQWDCARACDLLIRSDMLVFVLSSCDCMVAETESLEIGSRNK